MPRLDRVDVVSGCHESYSVRDSEHVVQSRVIRAVTTFGIVCIWSVKGQAIKGQVKSASEVRVGSVCTKSAIILAE